jgi:hypothetical protein
MATLAVEESEQNRGCRRGRFYIYCARGCVFRHFLGAVEIGTL